MKEGGKVFMDPICLDVPFDYRGLYCKIALLPLCLMEQKD